MTRLEACIEALEADKTTSGMHQFTRGYDTAIDSAIAIVTRILSVEPTEEEIELELGTSSPTQPSSLVDALEGLITPMNSELERNIMRKVIAIVRQHEPEALPRVDDEMVERVARALCLDNEDIPDAISLNGKEEWRLYIESAKAAIAAITTPNQPINNQPKGD